MISKNKTIFLLFLIFLILWNCKNIPDFPLEPKISNGKLTLSQAKNLPSAIKLTLDFTDGDGDLGLKDKDTLDPYAPNYNRLNIASNPNYYNIFITFLIKNNQEFTECENIPECDEITINSIYTITFSGIDTTKTKYEYKYKSVVTNKDTIILKDTILLKTVKKLKDTTIAEPFSLILRTRYIGRFPFLGPDNKKGPISGSLNYDIVTPGFPKYMNNKSIKLKVKIKDKQLNDSNEILSDSLIYRQ